MTQSLHHWSNLPDSTVGKMPRRGETETSGEKQPDIGAMESRLLELEGTVKHLFETARLAQEHNQENFQIDDGRDEEIVTG